MPDLWCFSSGRLSPTEPVKPPNASQPLLASDDDDRRSIRSEVAPRRTLVIPSAIPGKTIEIPLGSVSLNSSRQDLASSKHERDRSPKPESQMEKLTQRLKNLGEFPHLSSMFSLELRFSVFFSPLTLHVGLVCSLNGPATSAAFPEW